MKSALKHTPLRVRHPEWFGINRLIQRLSRNRARRNKFWGKHAYGKITVNRNEVGPMRFGPLGITRRDREMIARSFG